MQTPCSDKPFIIPVFIPHEGCPHQCVFCNQKAISGQQQKLEERDVRETIDTYLSYRKGHGGKIQISFYGGNFLGLDETGIRRYLSLAQDYIDQKTVHSIRCSTRPDTLSEKTLSLIRNHPLETVELGAQSMDDSVLEKSGRGHTAADTIQAVSLLKRENREVGLQMMVGLPGDSVETSMETARRLSELKPDFVRIYPTVVVKKSPLAGLYTKGVYRPLSLDAATALVKDIYLLFREKHIPVIRMGLQASEDLDRGEEILAGPYHPSFGHLVYSMIFLDMARGQLDRTVKQQASSVEFQVHPKRISEFRGLKNRNIHVLKREFDLRNIVVKENAAMDRHSMATTLTIHP